MARRQKRRAERRKIRLSPESRNRFVVEESLAVGLRYQQARRFVEAAEIYQTVLKNHPGHADALHLYGVLNAQVGRLEDALPLLQKAVRRQPRNAQFQSDVANALKGLGRLEESISAYRRATSLDKKSPEISYNLGLALRAAGHVGDAITAFRRAVSLRPDYLKALSQLGLSAFEFGDTAMAVDVLRDAIAIDKCNADSHVNLGVVLREVGKFGESAKILGRAVQLSPKNANAHCNLGNALQDLRRLEDAVTAYERAIRLDPKHTIAHTNLGNALRGLGRVEEAISKGKHAVNLEPRNDVFHSNLGLSYIVSGDHSAALACFDRATEICHGAPLSWETLPEIDAEVKSYSVVPFKLQHDAEQIRRLLHHGHLSKNFEAVAQAYEDVLAGLPPNLSSEQPVRLDAMSRRQIMPTYNRLLYRPEAPASLAGALNPALGHATIEEKYFYSTPNIVFFDDFLADETLDRLWKFCLDATVWYQVKRGYLGAYLVDGFGTSIALQIADELRVRFPRIFRQHQLNQMWAYKYDSQLSGIGTHADFAAVNVNFWVTPDSANRDPASGGLVLYKAVAPSDWAFRSYNADSEAMRCFLEEVDEEPVIVPYRQNRVVIFDSDLFHRTDDLDFEKGYENRRINITMLFGDRNDG